MSLEAESDQRWSASAPPPAPARVGYVDTAELDARPPGNDRDVLAAVRFTDSALPSEDDRDVVVAASQLGDRPLTEVWHSALPVTRGRHDGVAYSCNDHILFAHTRMRAEELGSLETTTENAYQRILTTMAARGFSHPLRMWNFFPRITEGEGDLERYKRFCIGRARGIGAHVGAATSLPAASAVGTGESDLVVYGLAARSAGVQIENPRQVSAFEYPRRYGPTSPTFSRAVVKRWLDEIHVYVSGTASIVGHASRHARCTDAQLEETVRNLSALVERTGQCANVAADPVPCRAALKAYVRHATDVGRVAAVVHRTFGPDVPCLYLRGDLCRRELLVEIEGCFVVPIA